MRPSHIKFGAITWPIQYDLELLRQGEGEAGQLRFGSCRPAQADIVVDPNRPDRALRETVLHEGLHAAAWTYSIDMAGRDEEIIGPLASAVLDMMRSNPELVNYLMGEDD